MDYQTKSHCKYLIALHLILVVKYRKKLLIGKVGDFVKSQTIEISDCSDFNVEEIEVDQDHMHILITIGTKYSVGQHVRRIKQTITQKLWQEFPSLRRQFWRKKTFWSDGYFVCSVGNASGDTIRKYIQDQG